VAREVGWVREEEWYERKGGTRKRVVREKGWHERERASRVDNTYVMTVYSVQEVLVRALEGSHPEMRKFPSPAQSGGQRRGQRKVAAGEKWWPEKNSGWRKVGAREEKWLEESSGWRTKGG
jgi:hypothetical protein